MSTTTPIYGWTIPTAGDFPNGPAQISALTTGIEATVSALACYYRAVKVCSDANIASLSGAATVDSYATVNGDIIFLTAQSTTHQNGPWVKATGAWTRPTWWTGSVAAPMMILVEKGTVYGDTEWVLTTDGAITVGTTATAWAKITDNTNKVFKNAVQTWTADQTFSEEITASKGVLEGQQDFAATGTISDTGGSHVFLTGTTYNLNAPTVAGSFKRRFYIYNGASGTITLKRQGSDTMNGAATDISILTGETALIIVPSSGTNMVVMFLPTYGTNKPVLSTLPNAKGDLWTATADNTPAIQTAGSNGTVVGYDSTQTNGLKAIRVHTSPAAALMGSTRAIASACHDFRMATVTGYPLASQEFYLTQIAVPSPQTLSNFWNVMQTAGVFTAGSGENRMALYTSNGTTLTLVMQTADNGNIWKQTALTYYSVGAAVAYAAAEGTYFMALMYATSAQTTQPQVGMIAGPSNPSEISGMVGTGTGEKLIVKATGQATMPSSILWSNVATANARTPPIVGVC